MKYWILSGAVLIITGSTFGISHAQPADEQTRPNRSALREACAADIEKFCADAEAGGHHVMQCVRQHQDELSADCKSALATMGADHHWRRDSSPEGGPEGSYPEGGPPPAGGSQTYP